MFAVIFKVLKMYEVLETSLMVAMNGFGQMYLLCIKSQMCLGEPSWIDRKSGFPACPRH